MGKFTVIFLYILVSLLSACSTIDSTKQKYEAVKRGDMALLVTTNMRANKNILFFFFDYPDSNAQKIKSADTYNYIDNQEIIFSPGEHNVNMVCVGSDKSGKFTYESPLKFHFKGGVVYELESKQDALEPCKFDVRKITNIVSIKNVSVR